MATRKTALNRNQDSPRKSKLLKVAETVGTIAGTVVGKKNQLVAKSGIAIERAKEKADELLAKKKVKVKKTAASQAAQTGKIKATDSDAKTTPGNVKRKTKSIIRRVKRKVIKAV